MHRNASAFYYRREPVCALTSCGGISALLSSHVAIGEVIWGVSMLISARHFSNILILHYRQLFWTWGCHCSAKRIIWGCEHSSFHWLMLIWKRLSFFPHSCGRLWFGFVGCFFGGWVRVVLGFFVCLFLIFLFFILMILEWGQPFFWAGILPF